MPSWDSSQYLRFVNERTQPAIDLAARVTLPNPARAIDLGCGPGNSTAVIARRWPLAKLTGADNSAAMLDTARRDFPAAAWIEADITAWAGDTTHRESFDLIFSNAALQWVPNHATLLPQLFAAVRPGGALAIQIPHSLDAPHQRCIRELAASSTWRTRFLRPPVSWHVESPGFYYDTLAPLAARLDLWLTDYVHVLDGPEAIVEWHRGTGLRPFLDQLPDEAARADFLHEYLIALTPFYPRQIDGRLLMPFRRMFVIAYR
jgi:trans-aconitate 2-methyltransferase